nr:unnamed protein product [Spirometra erinaceieuropaei]
MSDIATLPTDKGRSTAVMDKTEYTAKQEGLLEDEVAYKLSETGGFKCPNPWDMDRVCGRPRLRRSAAPPITFDLLGSVLSRSPGNKRNELPPPNSVRRFCLGADDEQFQWLGIVTPKIINGDGITVINDEGTDRQAMTASRGQIRRYKDTLKSSLECLQINPTNWEELALDRPTWRRTVKTGAAIYEANRIAAAKAKREARKSQLRPVSNAAAQPLPTCPRCQRTFRARIGLVGHLRINCASRTAPTIVPPPASSSSSSPPPTNPDNSSDPPLPSFSSSSSSSSPNAPTAAAQATVLRTATDTTTTSPASRDEDQDYTCPHCDRTFTSHIGLVGHLRIHRTETSEPVREAPTYTHRTRLHCPHCPRTFRHRMGLFGHMRIHESGLARTPDTPTTSNTSTVHIPTLVPSVRDTTTTTASSVADTDTVDFSCPHCPRTFTSRIGLVGHLRIHRTEIGEPVPGAPTYTHQACFKCPHCPRTFRHRMSLFGHMRIHDDLR